MTESVGHVRFRDWHISVTPHQGGESLALWLAVGRVDATGRVNTTERFGLVRIDVLHGRTVHLTSGTADLHIQARSTLEAAIACRALQIHLAAAAGYTVAIVDPAWLDDADLAAELERATRAVLAAGGEAA